MASRFDGTPDILGKINGLETMKIKPQRKCACGCGKLANPGMTYIRGHNWKGRKHSDEAKLKMSISQTGNTNPLGCKRSDETKKKLSLASTGNTNTLGHRHTEETKRKISEARIGMKPSIETRKKMSLALIGNKHLLGHKLSEQHKEKLRLSRVGNTDRLGQKASIETRKKMSIAREGMIFSEEHKRKMSDAKKNNWKDSKYQKKMQKALNLKPNKPEQYILCLLDKLFPKEYRYTGDFSFMINGKNPDFVNVNGQKKLIELYGDYWHKGDDPQDRIDTFTPFGYKTLVIWEHELKESEAQLSRKLKKFHSS